MPPETDKPTDAKFRIVFAIYPGMTHLDFTGPHQFLSRLPGSETIVASPAGGNVEADGLTFGNTVRIADVRSCDLICVPGGINATKVAQDQSFTAEIRRLGLSARYITSVCTGSLILGAAGLLIGQQLVRRRLIEAGESVVLVSINPDLSRTNANYLKIQKL